MALPRSSTAFAEKPNYVYLTALVSGHLYGTLGWLSLHVFGCPSSRLRLLQAAYLHMYPENSPAPTPKHRFPPPSNDRIFATDSFAHATAKDSLLTTLPLGGELTTTWCDVSPALTGAMLGQLASVRLHLRKLQVSEAWGWASGASVYLPVTISTCTDLLCMSSHNYSFTIIISPPTVH